MWAFALLFVALQGADPGAEGLKALEARDYHKAAELFEKAVATDPKDYSAYFNLALAHSLLGDDEQAIRGYKKVLELKPGLYQAELNLGIVLLRQKRGGEAVPYLESAARTKSQEYRPRFYLAEALFAAGEYARAEEAYRVAVERDPKSAAARLGLGRSMAKQGRIAAASAEFQKAAELDPAYHDVLLELAGLLEANGKGAEAIPIYQQFPDNVAARERLGELLLENGRAAEAVPQLEAAAQRSPSAANRLALAVAYSRSGESAKGIAVLEQAVAAEPGNTDLRLTYGRMLRDQRRFRDAAEQFYAVTQARPDSVEAWNELAAMLISLENYQGALAALDRIRALGGENAGHLYLRALVLDHAKQYQPALESYHKFLSHSEGKHPDEEFKARQRIRVIEKELNKR